MKKSIFTRYILSFVMLLAVGFIAVSAVITSVITSYSIKTKETLMNNTAQAVYVSIKADMDSADEDFSSAVDSNSKKLYEIIQSLSAYSESGVMLSDSNGNILLSAGELKNIKDKTIPKTVLENPEDYKYSTLDGLFEEYHFNYIYNVTADDDNGMLCFGSIILSSPAKSLQGVYDQIISVVLFASLWIFVAAVIAVFFITRRITTPMNNMSKAAKSYSNGNFSVRIPVEGNDEISDLANALNQMAESLSNMDTTKNNFLSSVSHDLRTPMTSIQGFIDGILDGTIPPEKHNYYLNIVSTEVKRLSRLVSSLLDISRMESGSFKLQKVQFDICEVARLILISFEEKIDEKKINIEFDTDSDPANVFADKDAIHQILYNLVDNALKFTYDSGVLRIAIKSEGAKYRISVYNTGLGIKKEELPFVFERFYKSDSSRGLDKTGTGLGLYIAKSKLEAHGEKISVDSRYEKYCEFVFTLPKKNTEA